MTAAKTRAKHAAHRAANDNVSPAVAELRVRRAENRRMMKGASQEMRRLCEELEAIYAVMAYRQKHPWPEGVS